MTDPTLSPEYEAAIAAHDLAAATFVDVRDAYRAGNASDEIFIRARSEFDLASATFDAAFRDERDRLEALEAEAEEAPADPLADHPELALS